MKTNIHICYRDIKKIEVRKITCPNCSPKRKVKFYGEFEEWYGWLITCMNCGDAWQDGEWLERPFCRGWRKERIENAKKKATWLPFKSLVTIRGQRKTQTEGIWTNV